MPAGWSSLVARQAHNLKVAGSNPAPATNFSAAVLYRGKTSYDYPITPAMLRLDPDFDSLRGDPAFQKLCEDKR